MVKQEKVPVGNESWEDAQEFAEFGDPAMEYVHLERAEGIIAQASRELDRTPMFHNYVHSLAALAQAEATVALVRLLARITSTGVTDAF